MAMIERRAGLGSCPLMRLVTRPSTTVGDLPSRPGQTVTRRARPVPARTRRADGLRFGPDPRLHSHDLGISLDAAKTYLKRVKARYQQAGIPVYTKLDLAERVRADWAGGTCPRQTPAPHGYLQRVSHSRRHGQRQAGPRHLPFLKQAGLVECQTAGARHRCRLRVEGAHAMRLHRGRTGQVVAWFPLAAGKTLRPGPAR